MVATPVENDEIVTFPFSRVASMLLTYASVNSTVWQAVFLMNTIMWVMLAV